MAAYLRNIPGTVDQEIPSSNFEDNIQIKSNSKTYNIEVEVCDSIFVQNAFFKSQLSFSVQSRVRPESHFVRVYRQRSDFEFLYKILKENNDNSFRLVPPLPVCRKIMLKDKKSSNTNNKYTLAFNYWIKRVAKHPFLSNYLTGFLNHQNWKEGFQKNDKIWIQWKQNVKNQLTLIMSHFVFNESDPWFNSQILCYKELSKELKDMEKWLFILFQEKMNVMSTSKSLIEKFIHFKTEYKMSSWTLNLLTNQNMIALLEAQSNQDFRLFIFIHESVRLLQSGLNLLYRRQSLQPKKETTENQKNFFFEISKQIREELQSFKAQFLLELESELNEYNSVYEESLKLIALN